MCSRLNPQLLDIGVSREYIDGMSNMIPKERVSRRMASFTDFFRWRTQGQRGDTYDNGKGGTRTIDDLDDTVVWSTERDVDGNVTARGGSARKP